MLLGPTQCQVNILQHSEEMITIPHQVYVSKLPQEAMHIPKTHSHSRKKNTALWGYCMLLF